MYFNNCHTAQDCKELYRKLAKKLHPDKGGNPIEFSKMQSEYENRLKQLASHIDNRAEWQNLVTASVEYFKATRPNDFEKIQDIVKNRTYSTFANMLFPKHQQKINDIINLFK